jgi:uncharacterized membrane protein YdjX (TVP38/TMEM64 family)
MDDPEAAAALRRRRGAALTKLLLLAVGLGFAGWLLREVGGRPGTEWIDLHVRDEGLRGEAIFLLMGMALTAAGVPRQVVAFLGGYAFGTVLGTALGLMAQLAGCALAYFWARVVGRDWAARRLSGRLGHRLRPLRDILAQNPFGATLALRLLPVGNNLVLNLLAGLAGIAAWPFLIGSAVGYLPQTLVFALIGKGVRVEGAWQLALGAVLLVVSFGIGLWLLRRHRAARALEEQA